MRRRNASRRRRTDGTPRRARGSRGGLPKIGGGQGNPRAVVKTEVGMPAFTASRDERGNGISQEEVGRRASRSASGRPAG